VTLALIDVGDLLLWTMGVFLLLVSVVYGPELLNAWTIERRRQQERRARHLEPSLVIKLIYQIGHKVVDPVRICLVTGFPLHPENNGPQNGTKVNLGRARLNLDYERVGLIGHISVLPSLEPRDLANLAKLDARKGDLAQVAVAAVCAER